MVSNLFPMNFSAGIPGKIKQNYHIEDWSTAIHQMLYNRPTSAVYPRLVE